MAGISLVLVEGVLEAPVALKLLEEQGIPHDGVIPDVARGASQFWVKARGYNQAAKHCGYVLGLTDLDSHACPGQLIAEQLKASRHPNFLLRIQVRELESWLIADSVGLSKYLSISSAIVPAKPDSLPDPKKALVNLARRCGKTSIREDIVPEEGRPGPVGPGYTTRITEFVERCWSPKRAARNSPSLRRALRALSSIRLAKPRSQRSD